MGQVAYSSLPLYCSSLPFTALHLQLSSAFCRAAQLHLIDHSLAWSTLWSLYQPITGRRYISCTCSCQHSSLSAFRLYGTIVICQDWVRRIHLYYQRITRRTVCLPWKPMIGGCVHCIEPHPLTIFYFSRCFRSHFRIFSVKTCVSTMGSSHCWRKCASNSRCRNIYIRFLFFFLTTSIY